MNETKTLMRNVRFSPAELAMLRSMAEDRSCSVGAVVRWAVRKAVLSDPLGSVVTKFEGSAVFDQSAGATPLVQP